MKVSVIIPAYNEEKYIGKCLLSLVKQEVLPDEIIVVDNNSTDKTVEICKKFPVRIVKEKTQGMIAARNRGFDEAKYEIIARCDADVILPKDWIKRIKQSFGKKPIDGLCGPVAYYDLPLKSSFPVRVYMYSLRKIKNHNIFIGSHMAITKKMWKKVRDSVCLNDKKVHEDIDLAIHINQHGGLLSYDKLLVVDVSGRRIKKNPSSFFIEYPIRLMRTFHYH